MKSHHDLVVVGGGPGGAATGYWAARAGVDVGVFEAKEFPREKTCGDGLTPRAVRQLMDMGLGPKLEEFHRYDGLRAVAHGRALEMRWPTHNRFPNWGYVVRRRDLDAFVADNAATAGAHLYTHTPARRPIIDGRGTVTGIEVDGPDGPTTVTCKYLVVADGSRGTFARQLGATRDRSYPMGMAIRGYYESPLHDDPWIESALDVRDRAGNSMPGYGWIFPVGDGTINVGIGLLSTFTGWRDVNTTHLMTEFAATLPEYWQVDPDNPVGTPMGGRLPMAGSVYPKSGPNWTLVGDSAGAVNPFNGEGIDYAYETGRLSAELVAESIDAGSAAPMARYQQLLDDEFSDYFKVARLFARVIGYPALMRELTRVGIRSQPLMEWALRVMANLMREDETLAPERIYQLIATVAKVVPDRFADVPRRASTRSVTAQGAKSTPKSTQTN